MYVGLKLHADAKLKQLMSVFEKLGISISYQREREINKAFAIRISERIKKDGIVVPTNTRKKVFTTLDLDNINQKKKSNLSKDEFHGTLISVTNHLTHENQGELQEPMDLAGVNVSTQPELPLSYAVVHPAELDGGDIVLPLSEHHVRPRHDRIAGATVKDQAWIDQVSDIILNSTDPVNISSHGRASTLTCSMRTRSNQRRSLVFFHSFPTKQRQCQWLNMP